MPIPAWEKDVRLLEGYLKMPHIREEIMDAVNLVLAKHQAKVTAERRRGGGCQMSIGIKLPFLSPDEDAPQEPAGEAPEQ